MEINIIEDYLRGDLSLEQVALKHKMGKVKLKKILEENNIPIRKKGNQIKYNKFVDFQIKTENKIISCKKCGKELNDVENKSGSAISHMKECYPEIEIPTKFKRSMHLKTKGEYWHFQYFNLIDKGDKVSIKCPICYWETYDIDNKTGSLTKHIEKEHGGISEFIDRNPDYVKYFNIHERQEKRKIELNDDFVVCKICGEKLKQINNIHLSKHGLTVDEYKLKYPSNKMVSNSTSEKLREIQKINNINMTPKWSSKGEIEINQFINDLGFNTKKGKNRKLLDGKEIDIIIEDKKLCIEYNGLYYHTDKMGKHQTYHLNKTIECKEKGYDLIQIFEDEWENKKDIVKNKIKHILGVNESKRIGARNIEIRELTNKKQKSIFLERYHLQGNDASNIIYGGFYLDKLVSIMTFKNQRNMTKNNHNEYELSRFATSDSYIISGLGSKMLKRFISDHKPTTIISFADRRWTFNQENNLYIKMGFKLISITPPSYHYYNSKVNKYKRFHKFRFGKNNIKKMYPYVDLNKSEYEIMSELGYGRIWDCGLFKYQYVV